MSSNSTLRLANRDDAAGIAEIYRPIVLSTPISFEIEPPDEQEVAQRIEKTLAAHPWLVCKYQDRVVGYAYASSHRERAAYQWSVDVSVYVHPDFRRRGVGQALYNSLIQIVTAQGYYNAYAGITLPNAGSVGLHESVGFQPLCVYQNVGYKQGAWHDVGWWELALRSPAGAPAPPVKLAEIQSSPSWQDMLAAGLSCIHRSEQL